MNGQPLKVMLVDDERLARAELRRLLAPHVQRGAVEIVGEAAQSSSARRRDTDRVMPSGAWWAGVT